MTETTKRKPGRPRGALNNSKQTMLAAMRTRYGKDFDPVMKIAENAQRLDQIAQDAMETLKKLVDMKPETVEDMQAMSRIAEQARPAVVDAVNAWDKLSVYCRPKLKSVDVDVNSSGRPMVKRIDLSGASRQMLENVVGIEQQEGSDKPVVKL